MALVLQLLGAVRATWQGAPLKFATDHTRALFAYLAVEADTFHNRSQLATLLWPEENEAHVRHNLRQALFFLRQSLCNVPERDELLAVTPTRLHWKKAGSIVDLHTFQQYWQASQHHRHTPGEYCATCLECLTQAAAHYQGEFLHGLLLKANPLFEEWVIFRREQAHRQVMTVLSKLAAHYIAIGSHAQAQPYAARQVELEPWHEEGHRQLMWALAAQGQQSAALRQYESCRRLLEQELGAPPTAETTQLYEQIRAGQFQPITHAPTQSPRQGTTQAQAEPATVHLPNARPQRSHNLPATLAPLVGRSAQLVELRTLLQDPSRRLITIVGMGGMGKSRLALALLEEVVAATPSPFAHGCWFVRLAGVTTDTALVADGLAGAILQALELSPTQTTLQGALLHYLAERQLLLVLDGFEDLLLAEGTAIAATDFLLTLLQVAPKVTIIVTSRLPLKLLAETVLRLEGLPGPMVPVAKLNLRDAANYASIRLFVYHAQRTLPSFSLSDENLPAIVQLCQTLSGMPLAIELAAALLPHFTPEELGIAVRQNLALLASTRRDLNARHRQFSAVLHSSWQMLTVREQAILAQSAIFVGPFSRVAAQAVTGATVSELASLVDNALLQQPGVGLYQLHDLLRHFAAEQLQEQPMAANAVADQHSRYYLDFVVQREQIMMRSAPRQAVAELQPEFPNIRQAWGWTANQLHQSPFAREQCERLKRSAYTLAHFCIFTCRYEEGVMIFRQAGTSLQRLLETSGTRHDCAAPHSLEAAHTAQLLSQLVAFEALFLCFQGKFDASQRLAQQAIELAQRSNNRAGEVIGLQGLIHGAYITGRYTEAKAYCQRVLACLEATQSSQDGAESLPSELVYGTQAMTAIYLGAIAKSDNAIQEAATYFQQALQLSQRLGKVMAGLDARLNLADLARYQQQYATARPAYEEVVRIAGQLSNQRAESIARFELADVLRGLGEYGQALAQLNTALTLFGEIHDRLLELFATCALTALYGYLGDEQSAEQALQTAFTKCAELSMPDAKLMLWLTAARFYAVTGNDAETLAYATRCQESAQEHKQRQLEAAALLYRGFALERLTRWAEARTAFAQALASYQILGMRPALVDAQAGLARVALATADLDVAQGLVEEILTFFATMPNIGLDEPFLIYLTCHQVLTANADPRAAAVAAAGVTELYRYAAHITDGHLRASFLTNVPTHAALAQSFPVPGIEPAATDIITASMAPTLKPHTR